MTTSNDPDEIRADIERTRAALSESRRLLRASSLERAGRQVAGQGARATSRSGSWAPMMTLQRLCGWHGSDRASQPKCGASGYTAKETVGEKASDSRDAVRDAPGG